eukprot:543287-Pyramimonas_sp.AAC.1
MTEGGRCPKKIAHRACVGNDRSQCAAFKAPSANGKTTAWFLHAALALHAGKHHHVCLSMWHGESGSQRMETAASEATTWTLTGSKEISDRWS